ncbi:MAG: hypothetical protein ACP6IP_02000 [Candidatus Njordarchaeia archaeon]
MKSVSLDVFNCIEIDALYLILQKTPQQLLEKILEIRYDLNPGDINILMRELRSKIGENAGLKNMNTFADRYRNEIYNLKDKCFNSQYQKIKQIIKKLDEYKLKFLRFVIQRGTWKSIDKDITDVIIGSFQACNGPMDFSQVNELIELLVKAGINLNARIINGKINEWLEIPNHLWRAFSGQAVAKKIVGNYQLTMERLRIDESSLRFMEILLKTIEKDMLFVPKNYVQSLYMLNFGNRFNLPETLGGILYEDKYYYYICPEKMDDLKKVVTEWKRSVSGNMAKEINIKDVVFNNEILAHISKVDENTELVISPWFIYPKPEPTGVDPPEAKFLSLNQPVVIITNMQGFNPYIREIEESPEIRNIAIIALSDNIAEFYMKNENGDKNLIGLIKEIFRDTKIRDVTCQILQKFYPLDPKCLMEYAERKLSIDDLYILANKIGIEAEYNDKLVLVKKLFEELGTSEFSKIVGYPSVIRCKN